MTATRIKFDFNFMMSDYLGDRGIAKAQLEAIVPKLSQALKALNDNRGQGMTLWMDMPFTQDAVVAEIEALAGQLREEFENFVVLGIGGSALGPIAVQQALNHPRYNELPAAKRGGPRLYVEDNVDPERMQALFDVIDPKKTVFNVITKSGSTSETMSQFMIVREILRNQVGPDYARHIIATTDAQKGSLTEIAKAEGYRMLVVPDGVGGRFSEICPVGLLPAAVCGIDIKAMLQGAAMMDRWCREEELTQNPAMFAAGLSYLAMNRGINISVMMPYADSLKYMSDWYAQLWAESLGKRYDRQGREVYVGQTPVKALGVTDQHSQVQLYAEGPFDKFLIFLGVERYRTAYPIPKVFEDRPNVGFLGGHTLNELIQTEQAATEYALYKAGKMSQTITLPEVNAHTLGQLMYFFMMQTAFMGELLDIDAFDQPGVEEGKNATYALIGRPGYEQKKAELDARPPKTPGYIIK